MSDSNGLTDDWVNQLKVPYGDTIDPEYHQDGPFSKWDTWEEFFQ